MPKILQSWFKKCGGMLNGYFLLYTFLPVFNQPSKTNNHRDKWDLLVLLRCHFSCLSLFFIPVENQTNIVHLLYFTEAEIMCKPEEAFSKFCYMESPSYLFFHMHCYSWMIWNSLSKLGTDVENHLVIRTDDFQEIGETESFRLLFLLKILSQ